MKTPKFIKNSFLALLALTFVSSNAFAAASTSTADTDDLLSKLKANGISSSYFGAMSTPMNDSFSLYNSITVNKKLESGASIYIQPRFNIAPADSSLLNTRIGLKKAGLISNKTVDGEFSLYGKVDLEIGHQSSPFLLAPGSFQMPTYKMKDVTLGAYSSIRYYAFAGNNGTRDIGYGIEPWINYSIKDNLRALASFENYFQHMKGDTLSTWSSSSNLKAGASWDVTSKFNLEPFLQMDPSNLELSSTTFNVYISGTIF